MNNIPKHIAIIMDGNRRWSVKHGLPYVEGHKESLKRIEEIIELAVEKKVKYLTLWAWSTKNWKRNPEFIKDIIKLFRENLTEKGIFGRAIKKGAKLHHIGTLDKWPKDIQQKVPKLIAKDPKNKVIDVNLALGYEGRDEIIRSIKKLVSTYKLPTINSKLTQEFFSNMLDTSHCPDVDLMIRTGGELRTSGFLIWQIANAELYFTKTLFPDFGKEALQKALNNYSKRERRLGGDSKKY